MLPRLTFAAIALFWVTMNVLLWRSEFTKKGEIASEIPAERVWEKVLMSPDSSSLEIRHHKEKVGSCRWVSRVAEETARQAFSEDFQPDQKTEAPGSYILELEGSVMLEKLTNTMRFDLTLKLSPEHTWEEFRLRLSMRPDSWEISADAAEEKAHIIVSDETGGFNQTYTFSELRNPETLLRDFGGPLAVSLVSGLGLSAGKTNRTDLSLGLDWKAYHHQMQFGHSKVRAYRLEAKLLDRFKVFIFVSRIGEILWVHLPDEWVLSNDTFGHF